MSLYYECHITTELLTEHKWEILQTIVKRWGFWASTWALYVIDEYKFFCTGRAKDYNDLENRMLHIINELQNAGIKVWRYKIEDTVLDSKIDDTLNLVDIKENSLLEDFDKEEV